MAGSAGATTHAHSTVCLPSYCTSMSDPHYRRLGPGFQRTRSKALSRKACDVCSWRSVVSALARTKLTTTPWNAKLREIRPTYARCVLLSSHKPLRNKRKRLKCRKNRLSQQQQIHRVHATHATRHSLSTTKKAAYHTRLLESLIANRVQGAKTARSVVLKYVPGQHGSGIATSDSTVCAVFFSR